MCNSYCFANSSSSIKCVKVIGADGSASYSAIIAALNWLYNNAQKPAVINMSLGGINT